MSSVMNVAPFLLSEITLLINNFDSSNDAAGDNGSLKKSKTSPHIVRRTLCFSIFSGLYS